MKFVCCPYCDTVFEQVGFRPMQFSCPTCGSIGEWYNGLEVVGENIGLIQYSLTDSVLDYWNYTLEDYYEEAREILDQFMLLVEQTLEFAEYVLSELEIALEEALADGDVTSAAIIMEAISELMMLIDYYTAQAEKYLTKLESYTNVLFELIEKILIIIEEFSTEMVSSDNPWEIETNYADEVIMPAHREAMQKIGEVYIEFMLVTNLIHNQMERLLWVI